MSASSIKTEDVLMYEMSPISTLLFDKNGDMRLNNQNSELKNISRQKFQTDTLSQKHYYIKKRKFLVMIMQVFSVKDLI